MHLTTGPEYFAYFGYGSLVNRSTHQSEIAGYSRVKLKGWRRQWLPRPLGKFGHVALLSVYPDQQSEIDGLLILDHIDNLAALDAREIRYDRTRIEFDSFSANLPVNELDGNFQDSPISIYQAKSVPPFAGAEKCRILRSYLDAVMQGYLNEFGIEGLNSFIASTDNFEIGIREDRKKPVYSRPITLKATEHMLFDRLVPSSM